AHGQPDQVAAADFKHGGGKEDEEAHSSSSRGRQTLSCSSPGAVRLSTSSTMSYCATPATTKGSVADRASSAARSPRARMAPPVRGSLRPEARKRPAS